MYIVFLILLDVDLSMADVVIKPVEFTYNKSFPNVQWFDWNEGCRL